MIYSQEIIEEVRSLNDIVDVVSGYVQLKSSGGRLFGLCPFHHEKSASFSVSSDQQMYYCFGCQAGGNVISFVMQIENYDFLDALKFLADRARFVLPAQTDNRSAQKTAREKETLAEINKAAARFFYDCLQADTAEAKAARIYLDERGVRPKARIQYGLGLSPPGWDGLCRHLTAQGHSGGVLVKAGLAVANKTNADRYYDRFRGRLMFPILDYNGQVVGFGGRVMGEGEPKYLNSPETPLFDKSRQLYGLNLARKVKAKEIVLVEGYMDVVSLHQSGFPNAAGVLGTALSADHARLIKKINCESVILLLDSDEAGTKAALRAIPVLLDGGIKVRVLQVTGAKDPDEFLNKYGPERFGQLLANAQSHIAFRVGLLRKRYSLENMDERVSFTQEAAALLATLTSAIEADAYAAEIAEMTGISVSAIHAEMGRQPQYQQTRRPLAARRELRPPGAEAGLRDAQRHLIGLLFNYPSACQALKASQALHPKEMTDGVGVKLLDIAFDNAGSPLMPADALSRFETLAEQRQAAEMLRDSFTYDGRAEIEKALNETVMVIKRAYLTQQMEMAKKDGEIDLNTVKSLSEAMRSLSFLYITMTDG